MERHGKKAKNSLRAFFAALKEWFETPGVRGYAFQNAAAELVSVGKRPISDFVLGLDAHDR